VGGRGQGGTVREQPILHMNTIAQQISESEVIQCTHISLHKNDVRSRCDR
jgi:hypothetical protein